MSQPLRVLMLDDSEAEADLVRAALSRAGMQLQLERVATKDGFVRALREFAPQVVLADHAFAEFDAAAVEGGAAAVPGYSADSGDGSAR